MQTFFTHFPAACNTLDYPIEYMRLQPMYEKHSHTVAPSNKPSPNWKGNWNWSAPTKWLFSNRKLPMRYVILMSNERHCKTSIDKYTNNNKYRNEFLLFVKAQPDIVPYFGSFLTFRINELIFVKRTINIIFWLQENHRTHKKHKCQCSTLKTFIFIVCIPVKLIPELEELLSNFHAILSLQIICQMLLLYH